jgi:hypothetical protein
MRAGTSTGFVRVRPDSPANERFFAARISRMSAHKHK